MTMSTAAATRKNPRSTVMEVLAGVASVAGQNRAVAIRKPRSGPSSGRKYATFCVHVPTSASTAMAA